jgi:preprotein translocase subunit YajC
MLVSTAYAQAPGGAGGADFFISLLPLILIFAIFYFLLIRPQQKRMKAHREMLAALRRGDRVMTNGGLIGSISRLDENDNTVMLEVAPNVKVKVARTSIAETLSRTEPVGGEAKGGSSAASGGGAGGGSRSLFSRIFPK